MVSPPEQRLTDVVLRVPEDFRDTVQWKNIQEDIYPYVDFTNRYMIAPCSAGDVLEPIYRTIQNGFIIQTTTTK